MQGEPPAVARQRVRRALRKARQATDLSQGDVAKRLGWSLSKMQRIEGGEVGVSATDLRALLGVYGVVDADEIERLTEGARASRRQRWSVAPEHRDHLTPGLRDLLQFESEATAIRVYQPLLIPGIVQTPALADVILGWWDRSLSDEDRRVRYDVRMLRRKHVIERAGAPEFLLILDESVIMRRVGGAKIMAEQLEDLVEVAQQPNVRIRIVPLDRGARVGNVGSYQIMSLGDDDDVALYREALDRDSVTYDQDENDIYREVFEKLWEQSFSEAATLRAITAEAARLRSSLDQHGVDD